MRAGALADRVLGIEHDVSRIGRPGLRFLAVAAFLAVLIVLRRPDVVSAPQFWAEDSTVYFWQQLTLGFGGALRAFWNGYPNLLQRLIAWCGAQVPMVSAPAVYSWSAVAVTGLALAAFSLPAFRHLVRDDVLRVAWCVAVVCLPVDQEMLGTPTNLGWYVAVWLALLSVMQLPAAWWANLGLAAAGGVAVWSTPLGFVTLPLWLLRAWRGAKRRCAPHVALALVLLATLAAVVVVTRDLGVSRITVRLPGDEAFEMNREVRVLVVGWARLAADRIAALVLPAGQHAVRVAGVAAAVAAGFAALIVMLGRAGRWVALPGVLVGAYFALSALALSVAGRPALVMVRPDAIPSRYGLFPSAMLLLVLVAALDGLSRRARAVTATLAGIVCLVAWSPAFAITPFVDRKWASRVPQLEHKLALLTDEPLVIPMNPSSNPLALDARRPSKEIDVPPDEIIGALGVYGGLFQTFLCRCDLLSEVDLYLGALATSEAGEVVLTVTDPRGRPAASVRQRRADFGARQGWRRFYFPPLAASAGGTFGALIQAIDNEGDASIVVFGSRGDPYPAGQAITAGKPIDADAAIRYGCTVPGTAVPRPPGFRRFPTAPGPPADQPPGANNR